MTDSSDSAFFKVPPSWHEVNESTLQTAEGSSNADGTYLGDGPSLEAEPGSGPASSHGS